MNPSFPADKQLLDMGVVHGRFQVLHLDHLKYILAGKERCRHLIIGITNPDPSLTGSDDAAPLRSAAFSNPLTYFERYQVVREVLRGAGLPEREFSVVPFPVNFPDLYRYYAPSDATYFLTIYDDWGRRKLDLFRSAGLRTEVLWERSPVEKGISAEQVRRLMTLGEPWEQLVPAETAAFMHRWDIPARVRRFHECQS